MFFGWSLRWRSLPNAHKRPDVARLRKITQLMNASLQIVGETDINIITRQAAKSIHVKHKRVFLSTEGGTCLPARKPRLW